MPILRNPFSTRAGLIVSSDTSMGTTDRRIKRLGHRISKLQDKLRPLSAAAAFLAVCILVLVPATILSGRFLVFWKPLTLVLLATQFAVAAEFYLAARNWRRLERRSFWESFVAVCLNPLSAIRSADTIMRWNFSRTNISTIIEAVSDQ